MCETCLHINASAGVKNYDPTHTLTLRNAFVAEMKRRMKLLAKHITQAVVNLDVFGLDEAAMLTNANMPGRRAFAFMTKADKIQAFIDWLSKVEDAVIFEFKINTLYGALGQMPWFGLYLTKAYEKGTERAQQELKRSGLNVDLGVPGDFVYGNPVSVPELMVLFTRAFTDLKEITASMDAQISRILANGLVDGIGPKQLARMINTAILGGGESLGIDITYVNKAGNTVSYFMPGARRAEILARTEIIRAHHVATINEYRAWGIEGVYVLAEWATATDGRVCPECASLQGTIWSLDDIEGMIPKHPQCRCCAIPYIDTKRTKMTED